MQYLKYASRLGHIIEGHRVIGNRFLHLNMAGCNESAAQVYCIYKQDEPQMLESGLYLSRGLGRVEQTAGNTVRDNVISGHKMKARCIVLGPGVTGGSGLRCCVPRSGAGRAG